MSQSMSKLACNDDLHEIRMFEMYGQLVSQWGRLDVAIPAFESWQHAQQIMFPGPRALHARMTDSEIFSVIETLVIYLCRAKLAVVFDATDTSTVESEIGKSLAGIFSLDEKHAKKLQDLFSFYVQKQDR